MSEKPAIGETGNILMPSGLVFVKFVMKIISAFGLSGVYDSRISYLKIKKKADFDFNARIQIWMII